MQNKLEIKFKSTNIYFLKTVEIELKLEIQNKIYCCVEASFLSFEASSLFWAIYVSTLRSLASCSKMFFI